MTPGLPQPSLSLSFLLSTRERYSTRDKAVGRQRARDREVRVLVRRGRTAVGQVTVAPSPTAGSTARRGGRFAQGTEGAVWHRGVAEHPKPGLDGAAAAASLPAGGIELQVRWRVSLLSPLAPPPGGPVIRNRIARDPLSFRPCLSINQSHSNPAWYGHTS